MVCVNKYDLNSGLTESIKKFSKERKLMWLGCIPFDPVFTQAMVQAQTIFEYQPSSTTSQAIKGIWEKAANEIGL